MTAMWSWSKQNGITTRHYIDADELWDKLQRAAKVDPSPDRAGYWDGFHDAINIVKEMKENERSHPRKLP